MSSSAGGPGQPGQVSPDGMWRWDGAQWVPTGVGASSAAAPRRRSFAWIWWLAGGCAVLVVIAVVAGAIGLTSLISNFQHGGFSCLPSTFPNYPGTTVAAQNSYYGSGLPAGDTKECRLTLESNDDINTVTSWYSDHLGSGDWTVTTDAASGTMRFQNTSQPSTAGTIELLGRGQHTEIHIVLDS